MLYSLIEWLLSRLNCCDCIEDDELRWMTEIHQCYPTRILLNHTEDTELILKQTMTVSSCITFLFTSGKCECSSFLCITIASPSVIESEFLVLYLPAHWPPDMIPYWFIDLLIVYNKLIHFYISIYDTEVFSSLNSPQYDNQYGNALKTTELLGASSDIALEFCIYIFVHETCLDLFRHSIFCNMNCMMIIVASLEHWYVYYYFDNTRIICCRKDLMADLQCCLCARDVYLSSVVLLISNILINDVGGGQHQYHYVYMHL